MKSNLTVEEDMAAALRLDVLLHDLEAQCRASLNALLSGDLAALEARTGEQVCLYQAIADMMRTFRVQQQSSPVLDTRDISHRSESEALSVLTAKRVHHLGKVQHFLISRMQRRLRLIYRIASGPQLGYGPQGNSHPPAERRNAECETEA